MGRSALRALPVVVRTVFHKAFNSPERLSDDPCGVVLLVLVGTDPGCVAVLLLLELGPFDSIQLGATDDGIQLGPDETGVAVVTPFGKTDGGEPDGMMLGPNDTGVAVVPPVGIFVWMMLGATDDGMVLGPTETAGDAVVVLVLGAFDLVLGASDTGVAVVLELGTLLGANDTGVVVVVELGTCGGWILFGANDTGVAVVVAALGMGGLILGANETGVADVFGLGMGGWMLGVATGIVAGGDVRAA
jgi:hypothetical protein